MSKLAVHLKRPNQIQAFDIESKKWKAPTGNNTITCYERDITPNLKQMPHNCNFKTMC